MTKYGPMRQAEGSAPLALTHIMPWLTKCLLLLFLLMLHEHKLAKPSGDAVTVDITMLHAAKSLQGTQVCRCVVDVPSSISLLHQMPPSLWSLTTHGHGAEIAELL